MNFAIYIIIKGLTKAMKIIDKIKLKQIALDDEDKLFSEVNILKQLDHPNILKLNDLYQDDTNYYLITQYTIKNHI